MQQGAFVLIDCLGFKGIWKRTDQALLLKKLKLIMQRINSQVMTGLPFHLLRKTFIITPSLLSDSVAISLRYAVDIDPKDTEEQIAERNRVRRREKSYLVWLLCASTIKVLDLYLEGEPSLVLRGCITYGQFEHDTIETGSFIVGPAVDDAAEFSEIAQGAFVWLHPDAAELYRSAVKYQQDTIKRLYDTLRNPGLLEESKKKKLRELLEGSKKSLREPLMVNSYDMPVKEEGGGPLRCDVLNPLAFHEEEEFQAVFHAYEKAMSGNTKLNVMLKRQHTLDFLKRANEARREHIKWYKKFIKSVEKK